MAPGDPMAFWKPWPSRKFVSFPSKHCDFPKFFLVKMVIFQSFPIERSDLLYIFVRLPESMFDIFVYVGGLEHVLLFLPVGNNDIPN